MRTTSDGSGIMDRVVGMSKLGTGINDKNEISSSMNEMSSQSLNRAQTSLTGYSSSMSAAYDQMMDFRKSRGDSLSNDSSVGVDHATSASRAFQKVDDIVDSGWTITLTSALLRQAGVSAVYPLALANYTQS